MRPIDAEALQKQLSTLNSYDSILQAIARIDEAPTLSLNTLRDEIYQDAVAHGLWEDYDIGLSDDLLDDCHELIYDEVDELDNAIEDFYNGHGIERFSEELADVVIMCMSVAGKLGIDIDAAIWRKMEINKGRPWKHGRE